MSFLLDQRLLLRSWQGILLNTNFGLRLLFHLFRKSFVFSKHLIEVHLEVIIFFNGLEYLRVYFLDVCIMLRSLLGSQSISHHNKSILELILVPHHHRAAFVIILNLNLQIFLVF